jgi:DNA-binding response OmpR family regulator
VEGAGTALYTVLVVDVDRLRALSTVCVALADAGYVVRRATSFDEARRQLVRVKPDVLITAVRLDGYNGLHLVIRSRETLPDLVAIVTHPVPDVVLQADAAAYNAVWLVQPIDARPLLDLLARMLAARSARRRSTVPRRWFRRLVAGRFDAVLGAADATVVDLSYGGLRLQLRQPLAEPSHDVERVAFPVIGLDVHARTVWNGPADRARSWWYGLELDEPDPETNRAWRSFVDAAS